jgi:hypothetical protein
MRWYKQTRNKGISEERRKKRRKAKIKERYIASVIA